MAEETCYLIDFENVGLKGLEGAEKLTRHDRVYLFSTRNAPKIDTATLSTFKRTHLLVHEVPAKGQSLDMHLVSYLGYLLGSCEPTPKFVIISNDTDYDDVAKFWNEELGVSVVRRERFHPEAARAAARKVTVAKATPTVKKTRPAAKKTIEKIPVPEPAAAEPSPTPELAPSPVNVSLPDIPESVPEKAPASEKPAKKASAAKAAAPDDKTAVNNAVMKTLSAEKYDNEIAGFVASLVTKLFSEKNGKQQIYRTIISKYGQEKGLEIYRHIKKLI